MTDASKPDLIVDCVGLFCPMPILKTREALDKMNIGQVLELITTDPAAEEDMKYFAKTTGHDLLGIDKQEDRIHFLIKKKT